MPSYENTPNYGITTGSRNESFDAENSILYTTSQYLLMYQVLPEIITSAGSRISLCIRDIETFLKTL